METSLSQALKRFEQLIVRDAESFTDPLERQIEFQRRLERTRRLMAYLGDPQNAYNLIHIGGTSGKGSVAMLCESMLIAMGLKTGTHTTPYLQTPLEKARVNGRLIAAEEAVTLSEGVISAVEQVRIDEHELGAPHYAEAWLGLALAYFADQGCDAGVIEVGMGGRYDCTNVVMPRVSVISTVHYDHVRVLGDTLEEIAYHKAGIIKPGVPVVVGEVPPAALRVIEEEAVHRGARPIRLGHEVHVEPLEVSQHGGRFSYRGIHLQLDDLHVGLLGAHQLTNAAVALAALEAYAAGQGLALDESAIRRGLAQARFAGRLEVMQRQPMVVLDGAHNEEKVGALTAALRQLFRYRRLILVLGLLEVKSVTAILRLLVSVADVVVTTAPQVRGKPALPADELAELSREAGVREVRVGGMPMEALEQALGLAGPDDLVVCTGSLYLIGTLRSYWQPVDKIITHRTTFPNGEG